MFKSVTRVAICSVSFKATRVCYCAFNSSVVMMKSNWKEITKNHTANYLFAILIEVFFSAYP